MSRVFALFLGPVVIAGCTAVGSPIPVKGNLDQLVGEWSGSYVSPSTGRGGSILFRLQAGSDTATGDVLMIPSRPDLGPTVPQRFDDPGYRQRLLEINFVRCEGNEVTGWMKPYPDPDTGELTYATFNGHVKADVLEGTFVTYAENSGARTAGTWSVKRTKRGP